MYDEGRVSRLSDGKLSSRQRERQIAELARRQHGVVSRTQLMSIGFGPDAIDHRLRTDRLHVVHRSVYAVGHRILTTHGKWMAAVLAGGRGAALSHLAAGALSGLGTGEGRRIDVSVSRRVAQRRGLQFHRVSLPPDELVVRDRIPVTTVARTLLDLAGVLPRERVEQAISKAEALGLGDSPSLPELVERYPRRPGIANLRSILGEPGPAGVTRSELEILFLEFLRRHRLPLPEVNTWLHVGGRDCEVDCLWRDARLVAELDSRKHHLDRVAFETDRARDRALVAAGWRCMRITWGQLHDEPEAVAADLRAATCTSRRTDRR